MKSIEAIHRAVVGANEHIKELTVLKDELDRTKKQLEMANAELDYIKEQIEKNSVFDNTRKALDIATKCINWVIDTFQKGLEHESDVVGCCELSLERIEELKQKDEL